MKKYIVLLLVSLELYLVGYLMLVVVPASVSGGSTVLGIGFGFMLVFFTSIGIVLYANSEVVDREIDKELDKVDKLRLANMLQELELEATVEVNSIHKTHKTDKVIAEEKERLAKQLLKIQKKHDALDAKMKQLKELHHTEAIMKEIGIH